MCIFYAGIFIIKYVFFIKVLIKNWLNAFIGQFAYHEWMVGRTRG